MLTSYTIVLFVRKIVGMVLLTGLTFWHTKLLQMVMLWVFLAEFTPINTLRVKYYVDQSGLLVEKAKTHETSRLNQNLILLACQDLQSWRGLRVTYGNPYSNTFLHWRDL